MKQLLYIVSILLLLSSCKNKSIVPSFYIGMEQSEWKDSIRALLKRGELTQKKADDSLYFDYHLNVGDSILSCTLMTNHDGIGQGKLRILSLRFESSSGIKKPNPYSEDPSYPSISEQSKIYENLEDCGILTYKNPDGRITVLTGDVFSAKGCEFLQVYLKKLFGAPDSILDNSSNRIDTINLAKFVAKPKKWADDFVPKLDKNGVRIKETINESFDTSRVYYFYHTQKSIVILERSKITESNYFIPFPFVSKALIYQYSNTFENDLKSEKDSVLRNMKPRDLITIPLSYNIISKPNEYGVSTTYLHLWANLDPSMRKTIAEIKEIESLKGTIVIGDSYGMTIDQIDDVEIQAKGSLPTNGVPGILNAIGEGGNLNTYYASNYGIWVNVDHKDATKALKEAVYFKKSLSISFIPNAILFKDGSVMKE